MVISAFFSDLLQELLPYPTCLLYGCRLNGALRVGDPAHQAEWREMPMRNIDF